MTNDSEIMRWVVQEPHSGTAGLGVAHVTNPPKHETEYRIEQLWGDGTADPVYVGDEKDVLGLIRQLTKALQVE